MDSAFLPVGLSWATAGSADYLSVLLEVCGLFPPRFLSTLTAIRRCSSYPGGNR